MFPIFDKSKNMGAIINFKPQVQEDTFEKRIFAVKRYVSNVLMTLNGATVNFYVFRAGGSRVWISKPCTIVDEVECIFEIPSFKEPGLTPYNYNWKVVIEYADSSVKTYIGGLMPIVEFKTEDQWLKQ